MQDADHCISKVLIDKYGGDILFVIEDGTAAGKTAEKVPVLIINLPERIPKEKTGIHPSPAMYGERIPLFSRGFFLHSDKKKRSLLFLSNNR